MDNDFSAMLIRLIPHSYNNYLSTITATLSVLKEELNPDALMVSILNKFDWCTVTSCQTKDKGKDATLYAGGESKKPWKGGKGSKKDIECLTATRKGT